MIGARTSTEQFGPYVAWVTRVILPDADVLAFVASGALL